MADHPIRTWRLEANLSQRELADLVGVKESTVSRWELSIRVPRGTDLQRLIEVTGLPVADLIGMTEATHGKTKERSGARAT